MVLSRVSQGAQILLFVTYTTSAPPNSILVRYLLNTGDQAPNLLEARSLDSTGFRARFKYTMHYREGDPRILTHPRQLVTEGER